MVVWFVLLGVDRFQHPRHLVYPGTCFNRQKSVQMRGYSMTDVNCLIISEKIFFSFIYNLDSRIKFPIWFLILMSVSPSLLYLLMISSTNVGGENSGPMVGINSGNITINFTLYEVSFKRVYIWPSPHLRLARLNWRSTSTWSQLSLNSSFLSKLTSFSVCRVPDLISGSHTLYT